MTTTQIQSLFTQCKKSFYYCQHFSIHLQHPSQETPKVAVLCLGQKASNTIKEFITHNPSIINFSTKRITAGRETQTFKNYIISGLCSTDQNFPMQLWDQLLKLRTPSTGSVLQVMTNPNQHLRSSMEH